MAGILDYDALRALTVTLVSGFGNAGTCTIYRKVETAYDPIGDVATATEQAHTIACVVVPRGSNDISTPFDDRAENEFVKVIVPASGLAIVPQTGDQVVIPGRPGRFGITDCKPVAPDGESIVHILNAERAATT